MSAMHAYVRTNQFQDSECYETVCMRSQAQLYRVSIRSKHSRQFFISDAEWMANFEWFHSMHI